MTDANEMITWLQATWDERERELDDEERAIDAWDSDRRARIVTMWTGPEPGYTTVAQELGDGSWVTNGELVHDTRHVRVLWDPAQAMRRIADERGDIAAKRRILKEHRPIEADDVPGLVQCGFDSEVMPCDHVRLLALSSAGREGYRPEWGV